MTHQPSRSQVIQPDDSTIRVIPLTRGMLAVVDADDYDWAMQWKWYAKRDKDTGEFYAARETRKKGEPGRLYFLHRQLLGEPDTDIDHANGVTLDCRRSNLRPCTQSQNGANHRRRKDNSSGYPGVYWCPRDRKWRAEIWFQRKHIHLGMFASKEEAVSARTSAELHFFGAFRVDARRIPPSVTHALERNPPASAELRQQQAG